MNLILIQYSRILAATESQADQSSHDGHSGVGQHTSRVMNRVIVYDYRMTTIDWHKKMNELL